MTTTDDGALRVGRCACGAEIRRLHPYSWCTACGEPLPPEIRSQLDNPYTRTASDAAPEPIAVDRRFAGVRIRGLARLLDTVELGPAGLASTVIRALAFVIDSLFFCIIAWSNISGSPRTQRLGDNWAKTVVVHRARVEGLSPAWGRAALGIVLGAALMLSHDVYDNVRYVLANTSNDAPTSFARVVPPLTSHPRR